LKSYLVAGHGNGRQAIAEQVCPEQGLHESDDTGWENAAGPSANQFSKRV
jgi:hypothetical protein